MAKVSAAMVKELRDQTGAGLMDCKAALSETGGNPTPRVLLATICFRGSSK